MPKNDFLHIYFDAERGVAHELRTHLCVGSGDTLSSAIPLEISHYPRGGVIGR